MASRNIDRGSDELQANDRRLATAKKAVLITSKHLTAAKVELNNAEFLVRSLETKLKTANQKMDMAREAVNNANREYEDAKADLEDAETCNEATQKKWEVVDLAEDEDYDSRSKCAKSTERKFNQNSNPDVESRERNEPSAITDLAEDEYYDSRPKCAKSSKRKFDQSSNQDVQTTKKNKASAITRSAMIKVEKELETPEGIFPKEYDTNLTYAPRGIRVQGCGTNEVNGAYIKSTLYHVTPMFRKKCQWNGKEETFVVRRTSEDLWHIGIFNIHSQCMKHSMYVVRSSSDFPPMKGWEGCEYTPGMDPPPSIEYINKRVARKAIKRK